MLADGEHCPFSRAHHSIVAERPTMTRLSSALAHATVIDCLRNARVDVRFERHPFECGVCGSGSTDEADSKPSAIKPGAAERHIFSSTRSAAARPY
jgi:hypothetical protein